jgi:anti-sigma regulatory factor (Ser/Thr protein kinase)
MTGRLEFSVPPSADGLRDARHRLDGLEDALSERRVEDLRLLISELVTNSIRHAGLLPGDRISVCIQWSDGGITGEVIDAGRGFVAAPRADPISEESGWGLFIVERISTRWGTESGPTTRVWFELDL